MVRRYAYHLCTSDHVCTSIPWSAIGNNAVGQWMQASFSDIFGLWYNVLFGILIIVFTYFYTAITVPTNKMADDQNEMVDLYLVYDQEVKQPTFWIDNVILLFQGRCFWQQ